MKSSSLVALVLACGDRTASPTTPAATWAPVASASDPAVADVAGTPILVSQVAAHTRATGLPKRAALDDLVRQELLAQEARRRGYDRAPEVQFARNESLVRSFVTRDFGTQNADPNVIPDSDLRPVYEKRIDYFKHDRLVRVWNVCTTPEQARAIYEDARAHPPAGKEAFQAIARAHGAQAQEVFTEETSRAYAEAWRKALFAAVHRNGDLMPPAHLPDLPFPCSDHVGWAEEYWPARNDSFEQAKNEVRQKIWDDWRKNAFAGWLGRLVRAHTIETHPENLPHD